MSPIEKNARLIVRVLVEYFPAGATCEDLRRQFEKNTSLARQSFYNALSYAKEQGWLVGGARDRRDQFQLYHLNPDLSWKEPVASIGAGLEKDRLEYLVNSQAVQIEKLQDEVEELRDWSGGGINGIAVSNLAQIVSDSTASTRQRLRAAAAILGYRVQDAGVIASARGFLEALCANAEIATDDRITAGELLRKHEAPRIAPEIVRPTYCPDGPAEVVRPLHEVVAERRAHCDALTAKIEREMGLQPDGAADMSDPHVHGGDSSGSD